MGGGVGVLHSRAQVRVDEFTVCDGDTRPGRSWKHDGHHVRLRVVQPLLHEDAQQRHLSAKAILLRSWISIYRRCFVGVDGVPAGPRKQFSLRRQLFKGNIRNRRWQPFFQGALAVFQGRLAWDKMMFAFFEQLEEALLNVARRRHRQHDVDHVFNSRGYLRPFRLQRLSLVNVRSRE